jgi:hypothetical protein
MTPKARSPDGAARATLRAGLKPCRLHEALLSRVNCRICKRGLKSLMKVVVGIKAPKHLNIIASNATSLLISSLSHHLPRPQPFQPSPLLVCGVDTQSYYGTLRPFRCFIAHIAFPLTTFGPRLSIHPASSCNKQKNGKLNFWTWDVAFPKCFKWDVPNCVVLTSSSKCSAQHQVSLR